MPRLLQHLMEQGHLDHLEQAVLLPPLPVYAPNCSWPTGRRRPRHRRGSRPPSDWGGGFITGL
eukprot:scaffold46878_cov15-Phaeocystis_antarctica.AAC.1